jgi:hypothetical protein
MSNTTRADTASSVSQDAVRLIAGALLTQLGCAAIVTPFLRSLTLFTLTDVLDFIQNVPLSRVHCGRMTGCGNPPIEFWIN